VSRLAESAVKNARELPSDDATGVILPGSGELRREYVSAVRNLRQVGDASICWY
jgi:hypothetical protein